MKKHGMYILLITFILLFTGCSDIKYSISIDANGVNEYVSLKDKHIENDNLPDNYMTDLSAFEYIFQSLPYDSSSDSNGNYYANKTFNSFQDYIDNSFVYFKYLNKDSIKINGKKININIKSSDLIKFYDVESLEISLYIPYYVSSHNATNVSDNTYTWVIDDIENANIKIKFDMGKSPNFIINMVGICIIVCVVGIIIGFVIYLLNNNKKNNEI